MPLRPLASKLLRQTTERRLPTAVTRSCLPPIFILRSYSYLFVVVGDSFYLSFDFYKHCNPTLKTSYILPVVLRGRFIITIWPFVRPSSQIHLFRLFFDPCLRGRAPLFQNLDAFIPLLDASFSHRSLFFSFKRTCATLRPWLPVRPLSIPSFLIELPAR